MLLYRACAHTWATGRVHLARGPCRKMDGASAFKKECTKKYQKPAFYHLASRETPKLVAKGLKRTWHRNVHTAGHDAPRKDTRGKLFQQSLNYFYLVFGCVLLSLNSFLCTTDAVEVVPDTSAPTAGHVIKSCDFVKHSIWKLSSVRKHQATQWAVTPMNLGSSSSTGQLKELFHRNVAEFKL